MRPIMVLSAVQRHRASWSTSRIVFVRVLVWVCMLLRATVVGKVNIFHGAPLVVKFPALRIWPFATFFCA